MAYTPSPTPALTVVTGSTGFIGSHVVEALVHDGQRVRTLRRRGGRSGAWPAPAGVTSFEADLSDAGSIVRALDGASTVIHVAGVTKAKRDDEYVRGNVDLTQAMLEASARAGVTRFVHISSLTVVGPSPDGTPLDEQAPCVPLTAYGRSKLEAERRVRSFADRLATTIIRPPAVYGPRDRDIFEMFRWVSYGIRPVVGTRGKTLSLIHVHDLARGIVQAASDPRAAGQTYFISNRAPDEFARLIGVLARIVGRSVLFPLPIPSPLLFTLAAVVEGVSLFLPQPAVLSIDKARDLSQRHWVCSADKVGNQLGYAAAIPIDEGLRTTYEWYRSNGWL